MAWSNQAKNSAPTWTNQVDSGIVTERIVSTNGEYRIVSAGGEIRITNEGSDITWSNQTKN